MNKKSVLIIYTGGTIGMANTGNGYEPQAGLLTKLLEDNPAYQHTNMPNYTILEYSPLIDSALMTPAHWNQIASDIIKYYQQYDGFIVLHGTDTMAYTASALSFILQNLTKPVIFTGSQVALVDAHTDARENLISAMLLASTYSIPEVCVFFNNQLFRGNRCKKINANSFNAFASPNYPKLGEIAFKSKIYSQNILAMPKQALQYKPIKAAKLCCVTLFPGYPMELIGHLIDTGMQGIVLRTFGSGNAPVNDSELMTALKKAQEHDVVVINSSQCQVGNVAMETYAAGKKLLKYGVLSGYDLTIEAAICKLYYAFSHANRIDEVKKLLLTNIAGEMTLT